MMYSFLKLSFSRNPGKSIPSGYAFLVLGFLFLLTACNGPHEEIVLRQIRDVVVDASTDPMLKANAIFYNPNKVRGKLKRINVDIWVNGKKAATVDQKLRTEIPAQKEFSVPLEVKLAIKELGLLDTILGMIGGKKFEVHYKGFLKLNYHGIPIKVPVDYTDTIRISF